MRAMTPKSISPPATQPRPRRRQATTLSSLAAVASAAGILIGGGHATAEPAPRVDLARIAPPAGFSIIARTPGFFPEFGHGSGDVNGDGVNDILMSEPAAASPDGVENAGVVYVIFGRPSTPFPAEIKLSKLDGSNGFVLSGLRRKQYLGELVSFVGDVNGDGFDDIAMRSNSGCWPAECLEKPVIFFGRPDFQRRYNIDLEKKGPNNYVVLSSSPDVATRLSAAGDMNGDGFDDIAFALTGGPSNRTNRCFVLYGRSRIGSGTDLGSPVDGRSFEIRDDGRMCGDVASAGDFDGDGFDDLLTIGRSMPGAIVFGRATPLPPKITLPNPPPGVRLLRLTGEDGPRASIALGTGAFQAGSSAGIFLYPVRPLTTDATSPGVFVSSLVADREEFAVGSVDGSTGVRFLFDGYANAADRTVTAGGDVTGDGWSDALVCVSKFDFDVSDGLCLLLFGRPGAFAPVVRLSTVQRGEGIYFTRTNPAWLTGRTAASPGDINGDGLADIMMLGVGRTAATVVFGTERFQ